MLNRISLGIFVTFQFRNDFITAFGLNKTLINRNILFSQSFLQWLVESDR